MSQNPFDTQQQSVKIHFKFRSVHLFELDVSDSEPIGELRGIINDHPFLKLHPNFKIMQNGVRLNEVQSLSTLTSHFESNTTFDLQFDYFTNQTAEKHVSQCVEFFMNPDFYLNEGFIELNIQLGRTDFLMNMIQKQEFSELSNVIEQNLNKNDYQKVSQVTFLKTETSHLKFFTSLSYSRYNPVKSWMSLQDDFFYLDLISKENKFACISANKKGFFINESTETTFNPKPISTPFSSLFDLLSSFSPIFKNDLDGYVKFDDQSVHETLVNFPLIVKSPFDQRSTFATISQTSTWTSHLEQLKSHFSDFKNGTNIKIYRDWNEEFQSYRSLPVQDTMQQLQKTKILRKVFKDFSKSAQEIAKAIVHNHFSAVNPTDKKVEECFVFNNFFITYAEDRMDWETPRSETTPSTYSNINSDLKNLQQIYGNDMSNVNVINTCAVDYLCMRLVVQTMITGILHFDQKTWNCYGSIDDGKTFNDNQEFAPIFEDLCRVFKLKTNNIFKDGSGKEYKIHGSPEVKGIKAGDGRKYVMDLMKLSPRDLNYSLPKENEGCLIRPELIRNFFFMNSVEEMYSKNNEALKKEAQKSVQENSKEKSEVQNTVIPENENISASVQKPKIEYFNPNIGSMIENEEDGLKTQETENLKSLSTFILENAIPFFKAELYSNPTSVPIDTDSLIESMHKYGINVRYIGRIWASFDGPNDKFFKLLFEKTILIRSLRKYFRRLALNLSINELLNVIVHFLNCILGDSEIRSYIDLKTGSAKNNSPSNKIENELSPVKKNQKRKNKKKKNTIKVGTVNEVTCEQLKMNSGAVFAELKLIALKRYGADFSKFGMLNDLLCISSPKEKISFLREACKSMGIILVNRKYNFSIQPNGFEYPIKFKDIITIEPKTKCPNFHIEGLRFSYKSIENEMIEKNYEVALNMLLGNQSLVLNTYGIFNTDFVYLTTKIASLYFVKKQTERAIRFQILVTKICERIYGLDHFQTAFSIIELSNYLYESHKFESTITLHSLAILIFDFIGGCLNPSSLMCLQEIHLLYSQIKKPGFSSDVVEELLKRNESIFGETDERLLFLLGKLAGLKADLGLYKDASILQARKTFILKKILKNNINDNDEYTRKIIEEKMIESEFMKNSFTQKLKESEILSSKNGLNGIKNKDKNDKK